MKFRWPHPHQEMDLHRHHHLGVGSCHDVMMSYHDDVHDVDSRKHFYQLEVLLSGFF